MDTDCLVKLGSCPSCQGAHAVLLSDFSFFCHSFSRLSAAVYQTML